MTTFSSAARPRVVIGRGLPGSRGREEAPVSSAWGGSDLSGGSQPVEQSLAQLLERSQSQVMVLRRALDEAATMERSAISRNAEMHQRLEQSRRFGAEFDKRLEDAARAAGALPQAAAALKGLEALIAEMRRIQTGAEQRFAEQVAKAQRETELSLGERFERTHHELKARCQEFEKAFDAELDNAAERLRGIVEGYERRLVDQEHRFEERLGELASRIAESEGKVEHAHQRVADHISGAWGTIETRLKSEHDRLSADIDRKGAGVQARLSLILDSAAERVDILETQGARLSGEIEARARVMCDRASKVLGFNVSSERGEELPERGEKPGSVLSALEKLRDALHDSDSAAIRLSALVERATEMSGRVSTAAEEARSLVGEREAEIARVRAAVDQGLERLAQFEASLNDAGTRHAASVDELNRVREAMTTARQDLEAMAAASAFHAEQVREHESRLDEARRQADASAENARVRARALDRAMEEVTAQAGELVSMARDVSTLIERAKATRESVAGEPQGTVAAA